MFDRKTRMMLILGMLNDCYGDIRSTITNLSDFISSHQDFDEIEEFGLKELLNHAMDFESKLVKIMDEVKREVYK